MKKIGFTFKDGCYMDKELSEKIINVLKNITIGCNNEINIDKRYARRIIDETKITAIILSIDADVIKEASICCEILMSFARRIKKDYTVYYSPAEDDWDIEISLDEDDYEWWKEEE